MYLIRTEPKTSPDALPDEDVYSLLSHELRTPLAAILGFADLLSEQVGGEQAELVDHIRDNGHRLQRVLGSILELQERATNDRALEDQVDVTALVRDAVQNIQTRAEEKGLQITVEGDDGECPTLTIRSRIASALDHLLDNACKFTDSGDICVCVQSEGGQIQISIADSGIGLDEHDQMLREAFHQGSTGLARSHGGLGLGLYLAERSIRSIGGSLHLKGRPEGGTVAAVRIPIRTVGALRRAA